MREKRSSSSRGETAAQGIWYWPVQLGDHHIIVSSLAEPGALLYFDWRELERTR
jgi:hypothetical protein